jgi:hypothetical protein
MPFADVEEAQDVTPDDPAPFLSITGDDGYIAAQDVLPQPFDEEPEQPQSFADDPGPFFAIVPVVTDPILTAATEWRDGMGEFIPTDEEPWQPAYSDFSYLVPPSTIPPIDKQGLWKPVHARIGLLKTPAKRILWAPIRMAKGLWSLYVAKEGSWEPTDDNQGRVP